MTIDESDEPIRDEINRVLSSIEEVECDQLPISASGKQVELCFIPAYCNICRKETIHFVYRQNGYLYIKCHECDHYEYFGRNIFKFVKMYCPTCGRVTVHGIYDYDGYNINIKCLGCGRNVYLGNLQI